MAQVIQQHLLAQRQRRGVEVAQRDVLRRVLGGTVEAEAALALAGTGAGFRSRARLQRTPVKPRPPQQQQQATQPLDPAVGGAGSSTGDGVSEEEDLDGWDSQEEEEMFVGEDQHGMVWPGLQQSLDVAADPDLDLVQAPPDPDLDLVQAPPDLELHPYLGGLAPPDPVPNPNLPVATAEADGAWPKDWRPQDRLVAVAGEDITGGSFQGDPPTSRDEYFRPPSTHRMDADSGARDAAAGHAFNDDDDDGVLMFDEEMPFATELLFEGLQAGEEPSLWEERERRGASTATGAAETELHGVGPAPALQELCGGSQGAVERVSPSNQPGELEGDGLPGEEGLLRSSHSVLGQTAGLMLDLDGLPMAAPGSSTEAREAAASAPVRCLGSAERVSSLLSVHLEGSAEAGGSSRVGSEDSEEEEEEEEEEASDGSEHYSSDEEETWSEEEDEGQEGDEQEDKEEEEEEEAPGSDSGDSDAEGEQDGDSVMAAAHCSGLPLLPSPAEDGDLERQLASAWDGAGACLSPSIIISMHAVPLLPHPPSLNPTPKGVIFHLLPR